MYRLSAKEGFFFDNNSETVVLLLHGLTGSPFEMHQYGKALSNSGYDVFCPVLPGHCEGVKNLKTQTWKDWYEFVLEKFDELSLRYDKVFVSGICLGGALALAIAQKRKNITGVICLSTTLFLNGWEMPWFSFLLPVGIYTFAKYFYHFPETKTRGIKNEIVRKKIIKIQDTNEGALNCYPLFCVAELVQFSKFVRKNMYKVECPTLLIHSKEDNLTNIKSAEIIYENISSEYKKMTKLENSYHVITLDNDKKTVINETIDFIDTFLNMNNNEKGFAPM